MKIQKRILSLISLCALTASAETDRANSAEFLKKIQNAINTCFKAIKYTGYTLAVGSGIYAVVRVKNTGITSGVKPLLLTALLMGIGYVGQKGEKWIEEKEKEKTNDQKKGNENELLHSDSGMQSK